MSVDSGDPDSGIVERRLAIQDEECRYEKAKPAVRVNKTKSDVNFLAGGVINIIIYLLND